MVDLYYFLVYKSIKRSLVGFMKAVITGATGLIGRLLAEKLNHPMILTRRPKVAEHTFDSVDSAVWIPDQQRAPSDALEGRDVIFHLAGEPVATGRWTAEKKRRIHDSRVLGTRHLVQGIADCKHPPKVLITASAVGFYGDRGDDILDEGAAPGSGFLPQVCEAWEEEAMCAQEYGVRVKGSNFIHFYKKVPCSCHQFRTSSILSLWRFSTKKRWMALYDCNRKNIYKLSLYRLSEEI